MPIVYLFPIAEESRETMQTKHQEVLEQLKEKYLCEYRTDVKTVNTGGLDGPAIVMLGEKVPAALQVSGMLYQASTLVDTVTACLKEKGISHETPMRFNAF